jgi:glycosyltransferase involved in cell wall biosynthesis
MIGRGTNSRILLRSRRSIMAGIVRQIRPFGLIGAIEVNVQTDGAAGPSVAAVLVARNEEKNLPFALRSVAGWVGEIVVVDMDSTDRTVEIARSFGAVVHRHEPVGFADPARAFAIAQVTAEWVVMLDADELVTPGLRDSIREAIASGQTDAIWLPYSNYLFGRRMSASSWGYRRSRHLRVFRRDAIEFTDRIHHFMAPKSAARVTTIPYSAGVSVIHFNYRSIRQFVEKTNRYTDIEAAQAREEGRRPPNVLSLVGRPVVEFVNQLVVKRGYRDGWAGVYIAGLMAFYRFAERAKLRELLERGDEAAMEAAYVDLAEEWLAGRNPD